MKTKTKLAGIVIAFMLALSAMVVGIWAVSTATVNLGGNISFTADDVYAEITGNITGASAEDNTTLNTLKYSATEKPEDADFDTWKNKALNFADKDSAIKIAITIKNLSSERSLDVTLKDTIGEQTNLNKSVSFKNGTNDAVTENVLGTKYTIPAGGDNSATYTITLSIDNKNNSVQANYGYNLVLNDENYVAPPEIKVISNDKNLGSVSGGKEVNVGDEVTLTATAETNKTFLGWAVEKNEVQTTSNEGMTISAQSTESMPDVSNMQVVSTDATYTFTYSADKPTTYYALFNEKTSEVTKDNNITYTIYEDAKLASLTNGKSATGPITIPETITNTQIDYLVYMIGDSAFEYNRNITSVEIPDSVTSIGRSAFSRCGLTSIIIPDSVTNMGNSAFCECTQLESVTIGNSVTSIGDTAFAYCHKLTSIVIPNSVTNIGDSAFYECDQLESVTIGDGVTSIGNSAFEDCYNLISVSISNNSVTSIGNSAFSDCRSLQSITIPSSVTSIGKTAFEYCSGLTSITIPASVKSIGSWAFDYCYKLVEVYNLSSLNITKGSSSNGEVGYYALDVYTSTSEQSKLSTDENGYIFYEDSENLTYYLMGYIGRDTELTLPSKLYNYGIYQYAFYNCEGLTSIKISDSVTSIGDDAFYSCRGLTSVTIGNSVTSIGDYAFYDCRSLTSITIPDRVTSMGDQAFKDCRELTSVTIGNGVTSISFAAFGSCSKLTSVTIGNGVTSIGWGAFSGCSGLTSMNYLGTIAQWCQISFGNSDSNPTYYTHTLTIQGETITNLVIPDSVTSIGSYAFYNCRGLTSITIPDSVTSIGDQAFYGCYKLVEVYNLSPSLNIIKGSSSNGNVGYYALNVYTPTSGERKIFTDENGYIFYEDSENSTYYLMGYIGRDTELTLPSKSYKYSENYKIYKYAFSRCSRLTSITIPDSVTSIGDDAFFDCRSLTSITIGNSVTSIGVRAFKDCGELTSVTIGNGVTSIGYSAFYSCSKLTSVTIGNSVTSIGDYAFQGCRSLTSITIPDSVTSIGTEAFLYCSGLTSVTFKNTSGWWRRASSTATSGATISSTDLANKTTAATYLKSTYLTYYWKRTV